MLFAMVCLTHAAAAEPPSTTGRTADVVRTIVAGGETLVIKGARLIARLADERSTHYFYKEGRLSNIYHSDGRSASYYYDDEQRLERIEFSDGQVQRAVYQAGVLVSIDSSSGQRMLMAPAPAPGNRMAAAPGKEAQLTSAALATAAGTAAAASAPDALNKKLIAIVGWQEKSWECRLAPDEQTICTGRGGGGGGGSGGGGGGGGAPYGGAGWTPGDGAPSGGGGGDDGGGGGGGGNADSYGGGPRYPTNLPTRMSCLSAASETFEIMRDEVCTMVRDPTICMEQNLLLFQQLWQECIARFPH
ncbi:hypothetical protein [Massilia scottii]|uniref:hypothetical protein n=1 Tax=Massilia scottii TaxID=3057166 RepID=UPI002796C91D|nr:hypothetical protein [Massilia sp. CCM 9029]MDQ1832882.1 hypothetical protein [Massilia sp. CCM 9029]